MKMILAAFVPVLVVLLLVNRAEANDVEHVIRCESDGFAPEQCRFPLAPRNAEIKEIRMIRQYSTKPCIEGKTWEAGPDGITVTRGCRADFRIVYELDSDGFDRHDRRDRRRYGPEDNRYEGEDRWDHDPSFRHDPATDIVRRAFADILDRPPTREELQEFRFLIINRNWAEHQVRRELRRRSQY
jgi:hypothetical protein